MAESDNTEWPSVGYDNDGTPFDGDADSTRNRRPGSRERKRLELQVELVAVDGVEGEKLQAIQSNAVYAALLWLARRHREQTTPEENA